MKQLKCTNYPITPLFTVTKDDAARTKSRVGLDPQDHIVLNNSRDFNLENGDLASTEEFFILNQEDYDSLLAKAVENGYVAKEEVEKLAKQPVIYYDYKSTAFVQ